MFLMSILSNDVVNCRKFALVRQAAVLVDQSGMTWFLLCLKQYSIFENKEKYHFWSNYSINRSHAHVIDRGGKYTIFDQEPNIYFTQFLSLKLDSYS